MKISRRINAAIWAIMAIVISTMVCIEWHKQGCEWSSLIIAILFYSSGFAGMGMVIDDTIKEQN